METAVAVEVSAVEVPDRLLGFVEGVAARLPLRRQRENALVYVRGLIEQGGRKSLQPTLFRLEESPARYESVQQFLADTPWDPRLLIRACAERVAPQIGVVAWIVDDTEIVKDGKHSPGVKRQYSGTLGKIGNCQITVSVHAVGERGTLPLGWQLYLPEEWCDDLARRRKAKIPDEIVHDTLEAAESSYLKSTNDHRRRILANPPCARDGALTAVASARRHPLRLGDGGSCDFSIGAGASARPRGRELHPRTSARTSGAAGVPSARASRR